MYADLYVCTHHIWMYTLRYVIIRVLFYSCQRNPSLLSVQQHQSLATWLQFGPITSLRSSHQCLFGWPLGHLWSREYHSVMPLVHLLSFSHETCPAHWCLLVQIWWIMSVMPVFEQILIALFLSCSVSPIIIHSILHCVVTIFCSCVLLRDHVSLSYVIAGSMHSLCTFIFNLSGMLLFFIMESILPSQCLVLILIFYHHLSKEDVAINFFDLPSIDADDHFVNYRIAHYFSLSQMHIETCWFHGCFVTSFAALRSIQQSELCHLQRWGETGIHHWSWYLCLSSWSFQW